MVGDIEGEVVKKIVVCVAVAVLALPAPVSAASSFKNCDALRKTYPRGVAKTAAAAKKTGAKLAPAVYAANRSKDRDGDGVACEL